MKSSVISIITVLLSVLGGSLVMCTSSSVSSNTSGGGGTETVFGKVTLPNDSNASGVEVTIREVSYTPFGDTVISLYRDTSDSQGKYQFSSIPASNYTLSGYDTSGHQGFIKNRVFSDTSAQGKEINCRMKSGITVSGRILGPLGDPEEGVEVTIPGTGSSLTTGSDGVYLFTNIPGDTFDITFFNSDLDLVNIFTVYPGTYSEDTIYLKDVMLHEDSAKVSKPFVYYNTQDVKSLSVSPRIYKDSNTPEWYWDKEISSSGYIVNNRDGSPNSEYQERPKQVMLISRISETDIHYDDLALIKQLEGMGFTVFKTHEDSFSMVDTAGMDMIYISYHILSYNVPSQIVSAEIPMIVCESQLYDDIHMTTAQGSRTISPEQYNSLLITDETHPISAGLSDTVTIATSGIKFSWGMPTEEGDIIAVFPWDTSKPAIFAYEKGDMMADSTLAAEKRVGYYASNMGYHNSTLKGKRILEATINWLIE